MECAGSVSASIRLPRSLGSRSAALGLSLYAAFSPSPPTSRGIDLSSRMSEASIGRLLQVCWEHAGWPASLFHLSSSSAQVEVTRNQSSATAASIALPSVPTSAQAAVTAWPTTVTSASSSATTSPSATTAPTRALSTAVTAPLMTLVTIDVTHE